MLTKLFALIKLGRNGDPGLMPAATGVTLASSMHAVHFLSFASQPFLCIRTT
jgi:hypothetical protein